MQCAHIWIGDKSTTNVQIQNFTTNFQDDNGIDMTKLGFADKEKNTEELENTNDYISNMFPSLRFKNIADDLEKVTNDKIVD